jgi:hypothetical protein
MGILISALIGLALIELYAWLDPLAKWIVRRVAQNLPEDRRQDFIEQFTADLDALPNSVLKILFAIRDGAISANDIRDAVFRDTLSSLVDAIDSNLDKLKRAEAALEEVKISFDAKFGSTKRFVSARDQVLLVMKTKQAHCDTDANSAINNFENLSAPVVKYLSESATIFEDHLVTIRSVTGRMLIPAVKSREMAGKVRDRLIDPKRFSDDDEELIEQLAAASSHLAHAAEGHLPVELDFPQRPPDLTEQINAVGSASKAAVEAINRCLGK